MAIGAALAAALIGLATAPAAGAEGSAVDTAWDNFLQGIANAFAPEVPEGTLLDPDAFCLTLLTCTEPPGDQMIDAFYLTVNTAFQPEGPIDAFFDQLLGDSAPAATLDMQVSIDGTDLFPTTGNTATATSGMGDIAIAIGNGTEASATGGIFDSAFADGPSEATVSAGSFDSAIAVGVNSGALANGGSFDSAIVDGNNSVAGAVLGNGDLASVIGNNSSANAEIGNGDLASVFEMGSVADTAYAGGVAGVFNNTLGNNDIASVIGTNSTATAGAELGAPGNFDLAAVFGDMLHAIAIGSNLLTDIVP
jgi:hypothetical protein